MQSRLPVSELGRIWELSDTRRTGSLTLAEFMLAMFLAQSRIKGKALPDSLPPKIAAEVALAMSQTMSPAIGTQAVLTPTVLPQTMHSQTMYAQTMLPPLIMHTQPMPTPVATQVNMPAPTHYVAEPESILDFESQFPDITPSSAGLNTVKQSFINQSALAPRTGDHHQWAITPSERAQYESIFRRWDSGRGVLRGDQAREVFAQSSLSQSELAKVWMLSDINNQGELNLDEFSVAMHLIFRRLAGAPLPDSLPQELVPRSSKDFMDSLTTMKEQLMFKRPDKTPSTSVPPVSDFDYDDGIYQSAHRRRNLGSNTTSAADTRSQSPVAGSSTTVESVDQLRRLVQQRKDEIRQAKTEAERRQKENAESRVTSRWRIDDLKRDIEDIHRNTPLASSDSGGDRGQLLAKRKRLVSSINELLLIVPKLVRDYERISGDVADTCKELAKKRSKPAVSDMEARAARLVAQRMAALTGEPIEEEKEEKDESVVKAERKLLESRERAQSITSGLDHVARSMRDHQSNSKWEDGSGLLDEVRDFVLKLATIERREMRTSAFSPVTPPTSQQQQQQEVEEKRSVTPPVDRAPTIAERLALATSKQERDRILQDIAEERFRERQRALGMPDPIDEATVPTKRPEMQERVPPVTSNPFASHATEPAPLPPASVPVSSYVPVSVPPAPASVPAAVTFTDDSSDDDEEEEWDRDDSSDDDDLPPPLDTDLFGPPPTDIRVESPVSSVSFDTAFANPATPPINTAAKDESNPFLGLLTSEFEKLRLRALYPYHPDSDDELTIETGDLIETLPIPSSSSSKSMAHTGAGWLYGEILRESDTDNGDGWQASGRSGWFPKDYAETLGAPGSRGWIKTRALFGTAKYDYEPQHEDELKVSVGERVRVVDGDTAESWWKVRKIGQGGAAGMLPAMYIDLDK
ncbi:actin organization and endocytosis protein [Coemansia sp. RSA 922]|nr:actin organization and endocytosis protein [Coemansia sp. S3946]KAJ2117768.1 actin organization and endocytosis protein [Coemansia sp. RSA 922]